jgi:hypothetical protein
MHRPFNKASLKSARVSRSVNRSQRNRRVRTETRRARVVETQKINKALANRLGQELTDLLAQKLKAGSEPLLSCGDQTLDVWAPEILEEYAEQTAKYTDKPEIFRRAVRSEVRAFKLRFPSTGYRFIDLLLMVLVLARTANAQFFMPDIYAPLHALSNYTPTFSAKPGELSQWDLVRSRCQNAAFLSGGLTMAVPILAPITGPLATAASVCATGASLAGTSHRFVNHATQPGSNYQMGALDAAKRVGSHAAGPLLKEVKKLL